MSLLFSLALTVTWRYSCSHLLFWKGKGLHAYKLRREIGEPLEPPVGPAVLNGDVLSLQVAKFTQSFLNASTRGSDPGEEGVEKLSAQLSSAAARRRDKRLVLKLQLPREGFFSSRVFRHLSCQIRRVITG